MSHGWPGSFFEFSEVIEPLTEPTNGEQAFHVIVPSLPGFGFSSPPLKKEWTLKETARIFDLLMTEVLECKSYVAHGTDLGSQISTFISSYPSCKAVHLSMTSVLPTLPYPVLGAVYMLTPKFFSEKFFKWYFTEEGYKSIVRSIEKMKHGSGYLLQQATQPLTIGYALNDDSSRSADLDR